MTTLINGLYYMVDDWAGRKYENSPEAQDLLSHISQLKKEIALRLGADGPSLLDMLSDLSLELETLHGQALFRTAVRLGAELAGGGYSTSR